VVLVRVNKTSKPKPELLGGRWGAV